MNKQGDESKRVAMPEAGSLLRWSATELAQRLAVGEVSAVEVVNAYASRIEQVNGANNAIVVSQLQQAKQAAEQADKARSQGQPLGPLHGVPFTVKECFQVAGTPSTLGLTTRAQRIDTNDSPFVTRMRAAGGILLGKTNVPQLMMFHESDNPVYGRTNNPLDLSRTPGGSTGGEAAAIASYCSPLGLGNDLGGSIRLPAAWCGLSGIKPTMQRLSNVGITSNFNGMHAMISEVGPLARSAGDLYLALQVLTGQPGYADVAPVALRNPGEVDLSKLKVIAWEDDGYFPACPSAQRAVREAAAALTNAGVQVEWLKPDFPELIDLYYALMDADGGADAKRLARGSRLDPRIARILWMGGVDGWLRTAIVQSQAWLGHTWLARILQHARPRTADGYWQLCHRLSMLRREFIQKHFFELGANAILCPAHALPALPHGISVDLLPAASYAYLANLLGLPAGVTAWTTVQPGEAIGAKSGSRFMDQLIQSTLHESAGMPIAVQIIAPAWREEIVIALLGYFEQSR